MYLEKLTIQGFKSFAHPVELVFTRQLTAIVGPNGSGKSNIADSIRWVLGEQSSKMLRGKKADDVIFSGSDKKARLSFAQVDMYLDNADRQAPIDYKKIVVTRKIYRNGESEYLLNNSKVRLQDIQILLAKSHFGQKTYSVIGQGMIDRLLTISAAERKDFFDEATGVKQYQMKKEQAVHKLQLTHENLLQAGNVLNELRPRLRSLKRQVNKLEAKAKLEGELKNLQQEYYSFLSNNLKGSLDKTAAEAKQQEAKLAAVQKKLDELQVKLEAGGRGTSRSQNFELLQQKLKALQDDYNNLSREKTRLEGARDLSLMKSGQQDQVWLQTRLDSVSSKSQKLEIELKEIEHQSRSDKHQLQELENLNSKIQTQIKAAESRWQAQVQPPLDWSAVDKDMALLQLEQQTLEEALDQLKSVEQVAGFRDKLKNFGQKLKKFLTLLVRPTATAPEQLLADFQKLLATKDKQQQELEALRIKDRLAEQRQSSLQQQLQELTIEADRLRQEMTSDGGQHSAPSILTELQAKLQKQAQQIETINQEIAAFNQKEESQKQQLLTWQKTYSRLQYDYSLLNGELNKVNIDKARLETRWEDLRTELQAELPDFQAIKTSDLNTEQAKERIQELKKQLSIIGGIDDTTLAEYQEVRERHDFLDQQTRDLDQALGSLKKLIKELDGTIADQFNRSFKNINTLFNKYFKKLFSGGTSKLLLEMKQPEEPAVDSETTETEAEIQEPEKLKFESLDYNIDIQATPPGKKLSSINMLSGGEKALTAIALISAIIANNPSPFVVLDEVDAALDEANSIRFAEIVEELSDKTQFVTITHNRATMHQAKILYGVTMGDEGISHLLSVNFEEADKMAA